MRGLIMVIAVWSAIIWIRLVLINRELKRIADALEKRGESEVRV